LHASLAKSKSDIDIGEAPRGTFKPSAGEPIPISMPTVRMLVFWIVALLGAVLVYEPLGIPGLVAWTVGALAVRHSRNWEGAFPGDDEADVMSVHARPAPPAAET
jgi:hypothetical protein